MRLGNLELFLIREGTMAVDGGAVFGPVPQTRWRLRMKPGPKNRVTLGIHALAVKGPDFVLLIDAGAGDKMDDRTRNMYGLDMTATVREQLAELGIGADDVTHVVFTHLHTDHSGGATCFTPARDEVVPCFPRAINFVQGGEWRQAISPSELSRVSYHIEDFLPLWSHHRVEFLQGDREILPGIRLEMTGGHTQFHQIVRLTSGKDEVLYVGDLMPTSFHTPLGWRSAVDMHPVNTLEAKRRILDDVLNRGKLLVFAHDPAGGFWKADGSRENPILEQVATA